MQVVGENESYVTEFVLTGCSRQRKYRMEIVAALFIVFTVTVVGNGLIVLVTICSPRLHNPMYFFICNLSIVDMCLLTAILSPSIVNCLLERPVTSFGICVAETVIVTFFGAIECLLLVVMAYDRYVAISNPLQYIIIMNKTVCIQLVTISWATPVILVAIPISTVPLRFCGHNVVDHILCELKTFFKLLCEHVHLYKILICLVAGALLVLPLGFIIFSYVRIVMAILGMHSKGSRMKAFSTCGSHLAVVVLYFGAAMFAFLIPQSEESTSLRCKIITFFAGIITPMCNPFIYTLKNKDILEALKKLIYLKS